MNKGKKISFGKISRNFAEKATVPKIAGSVEKIKNESSQRIQIEALEEDVEHQQMKEVMGIATFGKKAKTFDVKEMMAQVTKTARTITKPVEVDTKLIEAREKGDEDDDDDEDDFIGPPIPTDITAKPIPEETPKDKPKLKSADGSDEDSETEEDDFFIPCSHEVAMTHGNKAVTAMSVDPSGARLASGSVDYDVSFWDFAGMDSGMRSFRTLQPCEAYPIRGLHYSGTGDLLLVVSGASQAKVVDRDGFERLETVKGDMYLSDQARTKGHTASLLSGTWSPTAREDFLTTSADGTARIWNVYDAGKQHRTLVKCRASNGLRAAANACTYSRCGRVIALGCEDGSLQLWDVRKSTVAPSILLRKAHDGLAEISCVGYSHVGNQLITRCCDDSMKLWDLRNFKECVNKKTNLFSRYDTTDAIFSPNDRLIVTCTSMAKGESCGKVLFYDTDSFELRHEIDVLNAHVIKVVWHPKLNQIFAATGNGLVKGYYDEKRSLRGATLCAVKTQRRTQHAEIISSQQVITPHALPLFRQERRKTSRKQMEKDRLDPVKSKRPDLPITSGQGGRVASSGSTLSSYVIRNLGLSKRVDDDQDPREAILKFAKEAEENPYWITPAYAKTQPINSQSADDNSEGEPTSKKTKNE